MVTLNDYLYSGDTVLRILQKYMKDLREDARKNHNEIDIVHCNFLLKMNSFPVFFHGIKIKPLFLLSFLSMVICVMSSSLPLRRIKQENIKKELEGED